MRVVAFLGMIGGVLLRAYLASVIGYAGWFGYHLLQGSLWRWIVLITLPLWALAMGVLSLPVALLSGVLARIAQSASESARWPAVLLGLAAAALAGTYVFIWYMTALIDLIDWRSRWPWPLAASLCAYLFELAWCRWRRRPPTLV